MIIDNNPIIDKNNRTIKVKSNINTEEEISISVNGLLALYYEDIENITDNIITLLPIPDLDWDNDSIGVIFTGI